jgi:hypothetical protein
MLIDESIEYDACERMKYHPEFHFSHGKPFTESDLEYICKYCGVDDTRTLAFAIGKTEGTVNRKLTELRKRGLFGYYKNLNKYWGNVE